MLKDRGSIKWTSLMLPEHVELLKNLWQEDKKTVKPILDEQELELLNERIIDAASSKKEVTLSVYENGIINKYCGVVVLKEQAINLWGKDSITYKRMDLKNIVSIN